MSESIETIFRKQFPGLNPVVLGIYTDEDAVKANLSEGYFILALRGAVGWNIILESRLHGRVVEHTWKTDPMDLECCLQSFKATMRDLCRMAEVQQEHFDKP